MTYEELQKLVAGRDLPCSGMNDEGETVIIEHEKNEGDHRFHLTTVQNNGWLRHNYIYKEQKNSKFSSAPYCSFYVPPREMYMLLLNLVIFLCYLRKCRNIFLYGMECPRFITVNITPICVQNRLPRKRFRLLFIMPTRKHKGRRTTIADGPPAVWGKKRCQMRSMM